MYFLQVDHSYNCDCYLYDSEKIVHLQLQSANNAKSIITNFILIFHFFVYSIDLIKKDVILTSFLVKK
ncbi:Hypothetical membrane associated protein [Bacillus thuringiensis serovar israelensis ATCC 35646]|nr:Hypothetical membrane associated protein [Bacillus thuringiensis serovar israelensis ATCC 35646]